MTLRNSFINLKIFFQDKSGRLIPTKIPVELIEKQKTENNQAKIMKILGHTYMTGGSGHTQRQERRTTYKFSKGKLSSKVVPTGF